MSEVKQAIEQLITDLDKGRAEGGIYTYGQVQERLRAILAAQPAPMTLDREVETELQECIEQEIELGGDAGSITAAVREFLARQSAEPQAAQSTPERVRTLLLDRLRMYQEVRESGQIPGDVPALIPIEEVLTALDAASIEQEGADRG